MSEPDIVAAGIRIADAEGLDAVSIRRVAAELSGRPMSIYSFVDSKQRLVELMVDTVMGDIVLDPIPEDWRAAARAIAERTLEVGARHPWLVDGTVRTRPTGVNARRHGRQSLEAFAGFGLPGERLRPLLLAVDAYTIGFAVAAVPDGTLDQASRKAFATGLDWMLDGFEQDVRRNG